MLSRRCPKLVPIFLVLVRFPELATPQIDYPGTMPSGIFALETPAPIINEKKAHEKKVDEIKSNSPPQNKNQFSNIKETETPSALQSNSIPPQGNLTQIDRLDENDRSKQRNQKLSTLDQSSIVISKLPREIPETLIEEDPSLNQLPLPPRTTDRNPVIPDTNPRTKVAHPENQNLILRTPLTSQQNSSSGKRVSEDRSVIPAAPLLYNYSPPDPTLGTAQTTAQGSYPGTYQENASSNASSSVPASNNNGTETSLLSSSNPETGSQPPEQKIPVQKAKAPDRFIPILPETYLSLPPLPDFQPKAPQNDFPLQSINLATAIRLARIRPIDVNIAGKIIERSVAAYQGARALWLPTINFGAEYYHRDGEFQNFNGTIGNTSRSNFMVGMGPAMVFAFSDAIFAPLAAKQDQRASEALAMAQTNDMLTRIAETYISVQQTRGEYAAAELIAQQAEEVARRTIGLGQGLVPPVEATRARVELARRRQALIVAKQNWQVNSAELSRLLRLHPGLVLDPIEPANLELKLFEGDLHLDDLITTGLTHRPELAANQAVVQATLQRLRQEKLRPLMPSLLIRGTSGNAGNAFGYGVFGGGPNGALANFGNRFDYDVQLVWELQNMGLGNRSRIRQSKSNRDIANLELFKTQDRIAAEVTTAFAQLRAARERLQLAEPALREAIDSLQKNLKGMSQTKRSGNLLILVNSPLEVIAALQALAIANTDYLSAIADSNRAQFRLFRAIGQVTEISGFLPSPEKNLTGQPLNSSTEEQMLKSPKMLNSTNTNSGKWNPPQWNSNSSSSETPKNIETYPPTPPSPSNLNSLNLNNNSTGTARTNPPSNGNPSTFKPILPKPVLMDPANP